MVHLWTLSQVRDREVQRGWAQIVQQVRFPLGADPKPGRDPATAGPEVDATTWA